MATSPLPISCLLATPLRQSSTSPPRPSCSAHTSSGASPTSPEVDLSADGLVRVADIVSAYASAHPAANDAGLAAAPVHAAIQFARSLCPLNERYAGQGQFPADLDRFWNSRQATVRMVLDALI
jgi:hypothetical protein